MIGTRLRYLIELHDDTKPWYERIVRRYRVTSRRAVDRRLDKHPGLSGLLWRGRLKRRTGNVVWDRCWSFEGEKK